MKSIILLFLLSFVGPVSAQYLRKDLRSQDPQVWQAQAVIWSTYGVFVSDEDKGKNLTKFGRNLTVGTSFETVGEFAGAVGNETFVTTNIIDAAVSTSASDTGTVRVEGFTIDASGNLTFTIQDVTLTGQTPVSLAAPLARVTRAYVKPSGAFGSPASVLVGRLSIYDDTDGATTGVPDTDAAVKLVISAGESQSEKCATSISSSDYWVLKSFSAGIGNSGKTADRITLRIQTRDVAGGGVWRPLGREVSLSTEVTGRTIHFDPLLIVPSNHDVRVVAKTNSNTAEIFAQLNGILLK